MKQKNQLKNAHRANSYTATSGTPVKIVLLSFVALASSLFSPFDIVAQWNGPAIEVPPWAPYIMIGKNDLNDASVKNHILTFGGGNSAGNCGLWHISGSRDESFIIGRTFNTTTRDAGYEIDTNRYPTETRGKLMIAIDTNMNVGIDKWLSNIHYKLDVGGVIRSTDGVLLSSDRRYKREIEPISSLDNLFKINAVQYKKSGEAFVEQLEILKKEGNLTTSELEVAEASTKAIVEARNSDSTIHYGFIAQELREAYPNLVSEDRHGFLSVNYTELIPVLVDAVKAQQIQIDNLNSQISELKGDGFVKSNTTEVATSAKLYQNNPNPFDTQTEINYYIPSIAVNATICIYDMVGAEVLKMEIRGRESGSIVIDANQLRAGMYMYALLVDGREIDVKRMILTGK